MFYFLNNANMIIHRLIAGFFIKQTHLRKAKKIKSGKNPNIEMNPHP